MTEQEEKKLRFYKTQYENALANIRLHGVPETRAEYLVTALDCLLTRLRKEIHDSHTEIARLREELKDV